MLTTDGESFFATDFTLALRLFMDPVSKGASVFCVEPLKGFIPK